MPGQNDNLIDRLYKLLASVRTGIVLLILVSIASIVGTLIMQRPITDPAEIARVYSPQTLMWLDRLGLTDVFHAWWFVVLMVLLSFSIIFASLERWPAAWRVYGNPLRRPEAPVRAGTAVKRQFNVPNSGAGLDAALRVMRRFGYKPQLVEADAQASLFAEKSRFAVMGIFVVHLSLLLILVGGMIDGIWGYKSYVSLVPGQEQSRLELADGKTLDLPFSVRCDNTGQENYPDGSPKKWWSDVTVLEGGKEVMRKHVIVNDPLVYRGLRFYQSGFGNSGVLKKAEILLASKTAKEPTRHAMKVDDTLEVVPGVTLKLAQFIGDHQKMGDEVFEKSKQVVNPAMRFEMQRAGAEPITLWLFPAEINGVELPGIERGVALGGLEMEKFTGLQVSREPGQWFVWAGCVLMCVGLAMCFYFSHVRLWAVPLTTAEGGSLLWLGGTASKNREQFQEKFAEMAAALEEELKQESNDAGAASANAGRTTVVEA